MEFTKKRTNSENDVVLPVKISMGWPDAFETVKKRGGMPTNLAYDRAILGSTDWKVLFSVGDTKRCIINSRDGPKMGEYYEGWTTNFLVYPESGGVLKKGKDIVDSNKDVLGRDWILPASSVPEAAFGEAKIAIMLAPHSLKLTDKHVWILADPSEMTVLCEFPQEEVSVGMIDRQTGVPLDLPLNPLYNKDEKLIREQVRILERTVGAGVRPISRGGILLFGGAGRESENTVIGGARVAVTHDPEESLNVAYMTSRSASLEIVEERLRDMLRDSGVDENSIQELKNTASFADKLKVLARISSKLSSADKSPN